MFLCALMKGVYDLLDFANGGSGVQVVIFAVRLLTVKGVYL